MELIPGDYIEFLYWLKNATENFWSREVNEEHKCPLWAQGAKWTGMTEEQINSTEEKYGIVFTPEHRLFLRIMHTTDQKEKMYDNDREEGPYEERSFFHNWLEDEERIRLALKDGYDWIAEDVEQDKFWLNSWGTRPDTAAERKKIFDELYQKAPKLVPIYGHRYQVADTSLATRPVLSVRGTDIVYTSSDFRYCLLDALCSFLDIHEPVYDPEYRSWHSQIRPEYEVYFEYHDKSKYSHIPFWKGFYLFDRINHDNNKEL